MKTVKKILAGILILQFTFLTNGSWNREKLTGYKIIRVNFENGKLAGNGYEDFVSGWLPNENSQEVWGRPVGLLVNSDGSLLIADDGAKKIWRVSYQK